MAIGASEAEGLLDRVPALAGPARAAWREAVDLRRPQGSEGRCDPDPRRHLAKMPRALRPQPAGPCRPPGPARRLRLRRHRLRPGGRRQREGPVASGRRPAQAQGAQAGSSHGRSRARRPRLHDFFVWTASRNARTDLSITGRQIAVLYPGLWCGAICPLALMESADPRLISPCGLSAPESHPGLADRGLTCLPSHFVVPCAIFQRPPPVLVRVPAVAAPRLAG